MKKLIFVLVVVMLASMFAFAQEEKASVFGGYQFTSIGVDGERANVPKGWDADLAVKAAKNIGLVGDFSGAYKNGVKFHTFMFGPRFSATSGKVTPFAEVLFGAANAKFEGEGATKMSLAFGGGLDVHVNKSVAIRLGKFDYNFVKNEGANFNNLRYATGIVFKF